jgi:predicted Fe-Mo cluster-binding NifX family protein
MGWGAFESIKPAGIRTVVTDIVNIEDAVQAYLDGTIVERTDLLH